MKPQGFKVATYPFSEWTLFCLEFSGFVVTLEMRPQEESR